MSFDQGPGGWGVGSPACVVGCLAVAVQKPNVTRLALLITLHAPTTAPPAPPPHPPRRFQPVYVNEPDEASTLDILTGLKERYETHHKCIYSQEVGFGGVGEVCVCVGRVWGG
jgi:hypothetical protein